MAQIPRSPTMMGPWPEVIEIRTSTPTLQVARAIADEVVESGLCSNAHIHPVSSTYTWEGQVERRWEHRLILTTRAACYGDVVAVIGRLHPYDLPAVTVAPILGGSPETLAWIAKHSKPEDGFLG